MSDKLGKIFTSLNIGDVIRTEGGHDFVVCRTGQVTDERRYVLARMCRCGTHSEAVLPRMFSWDEGAQIFCDSQGTALPGWTSDVGVEREAYQGKDMQILSRVLTEDDLPPEFDINDPSNEATASAIQDGAYELWRIWSLSSNGRTGWHSVTRSLGLNLSDQQLMQLGVIFEERRLGGVEILVIGG